MTDDDKAKLGYQMAIQLIVHEGQIIWRSFSAMATANGLVVGGFALKVFPRPPKAIPLLGFVICLLWFLVTVRQFAYYAYWFTWARALESEYLSPIVRTVSDGKNFAAGNVVEVGGETRRMNWFARLFPVRWLGYAVIAIFAYLYYLLWTI
jgi:hypothetical protein